MFLKQTAAAHNVPKPKISIQWNAVPQNEWFDVNCIKSNYAAGVDYKDPNTMAYLTKPCYNNVTYLNNLINLLCQNDYCPYAVYLDMDWGYNTPFTFNTVKKYENDLSTLTLPSGQKPGVKLGIDIIGACGGTETNANCANSYNSSTKTFGSYLGPVTNQAYQNVVLTEVDALKTGRSL